jgi:hypothetical protein
MKFDLDQTKDVVIHFHLCLTGLWVWFHWHKRSIRQRGATDRGEYCEAAAAVAGTKSDEHAETKAVRILD